MIIPHYLYVVLTFAVSLALAIFLTRFICKAVQPRKPFGCLALGMGGFFFVALLLSLGYYLPAAHIAEGGPDKEYSNKVALFTLPDSFIERYGINPEDTRFVVNRSDRAMMLYPTYYGDYFSAKMGLIVPPDCPVRIINPGEAIAVAPGELPDFFFEQPETITVEKDSKTTQTRWVLDYLAPDIKY